MLLRCDQERIKGSVWKHRSKTGSCLIRIHFWLHYNIRSKWTVSSQSYGTAFYCVSYLPPDSRSRSFSLASDSCWAVHPWYSIDWIWYTVLTVHFVFLYFPWCVSSTFNILRAFYSLYINIFLFYFLYFQIFSAYLHCTALWLTSVVLSKLKRPWP